MRNSAERVKMVILSVTFVGALLISFSFTGNRANKLRQYDPNEDPAVTRFREYLRIPTDHPNPDYESGIEWMENQAYDIGLEFHRVDFQKPDLFAIWLTWRGTNPDLKSILINSHMDVVAVDKSKWTHDPFEAYKDEKGNIFARGAVDMKCSTMGALEAIRRLKSNGFTPLRTIHVSIIPGEEIGGAHGMKPFVASPEFQSLNVGFDMDEMRVNPTDELFFEYGQKSIWQFNFTALGKAQHGSNLPEVTAGQKLQVVIDKLMAYRETQFELMNQPGMDISNVTSINLVSLGGGIGRNIIPGELWASFDMRIRLKPGWNFTDVEQFLDNIAYEAGPNVTYTFMQKSMETGITYPDDSNVWWTQLQKCCKEMNLKCSPKFLNGGTDGRHVRSVGIPVHGISGFINSPQLAHQDNEYINEKEFLDGISRYEVIIKGVSSVPGNVHP